jgi:hypothetical protein
MSANGKVFCGSSNTDSSQAPSTRNLTCPFLISALNSFADVKNAGSHDDLVHGVLEFEVHAAA